MRSARTRIESPMVEKLSVLINTRRAGEIVRRSGRLTFRYDSSYVAASGATPLSLSMPLVVDEHPHAVVEPFLWGLLPDNEEVLRRWGREFGVSARNCFALLTH